MNWQDSLSRDYSLNNEQISSLESLLQLLIERSDRNLTAVTSPESIVNVHFRDSIALLDFSEVSDATSAIDIGSGAGFPGLPLAIARPDMKITLLESNQAKCSFLQEAITRANLDNTRVLLSRAEDAGRSELRDAFDISFARAVGPLPVSLEYSLPLVKPDGFAVLQRGATLEDEEVAAVSIAAKLNASLERILPVKPYPEAKNLHVWFIRKLGNTPSRFPRKPGIAKKRPLR
jgi:16S rRNA (guanine527-N7)-methyltransferase